MLARSFHVLDWAAQAEGRAQRAAWPAAVLREGTAGSGLPMLLRRRLTPLGQAAIATACEVGADAAMHYVFTSRHGEFARSLRLLEALANHQPLSPAEFTLCVHNALPGLLSIARHAMAGHTAIAAGPDSLAGGLLEVAGLLAVDPATPVLLVHFDDDLPAPYDALRREPAAGPVALAVLFGAADRGGLPIQVSATPQPWNPRATTAGAALGLLRFLRDGLPSLGVEGARLRLEWRRAA